MKNQSIQKRIIPQTWLRFLIIILLALGLFFRFTNFDRKVYGADEVYTSMQISGHTLAEMNQQLRNGRVISSKDLQKYQYPTRETSAIDTIKSLVLEDSQNTPLYYLIARLWVQLFGNSVAVTRSLSAFISLLAFPCLYWLCQELFESSLIGWIAIALIAVSPVHVLYAQEARSYGLWIVTILLSSATLLQAMRLKTRVSWGIYAATVALGLYTHLFFGLVMIGHGIYVAVIERFRFSRTLTSYLLASFAGLLAFVPWLLVIVINPPKSQTVSWMDTKSPPLSSMIRWAGIISRTFIDLGVSPSYSLKTNSLMILLITTILILLILIIYSIYFLCRRTPKRVWLFVLTLIGVTGLALILPDLIMEQRRGTTRYVLPCILGIQLSVTYLLTTQIISISANSRRQQLWQLVTIILVSLGVLSCAVSSQAEIWWNKAPDRNEYNYKIAYIVNQATQPLLISDDDLITVQSLGHMLAPKVKLQLVAQPNIPAITYGFTDMFLFKPSELLRSGLERVYSLKIKPIYGPLWKIEKRE